MLSATGQQPRTYLLGCVVVTYNRAECLRVCLTHTLRQDVDLVLVIDNASNDNTPELLTEFQARDSRLVVERQQKNLGGAWGFARGIRRADNLLGGEGWLLLFDDDSWPEPECVTRFHERVPSYRQAGVVAVGAAVFARDGRVVEANRPVLNLFRRPFRVLSLTLCGSRSIRDLYHVPARLLRQSGLRIDVDSISFVGLFLDLSTLPKQRGRYPRGAIFLYSDDTLYTLGLVRSGCRIILDTDLIFFHDTSAGGAASPLLSPAWKHYFVVRNSFLMNRALSGLWYIPLCLATICTHLAKGLRLFFRSGDGRVLQMVALGVWDGITKYYSRSLPELEKRCS